MSRLGSSRGVYVERPKADIYTALLGVALAAIVIACALLALVLYDYNFEMAPPTAAALRSPGSETVALWQSVGDASAVAAPRISTAPRLAV